MTPHRRPVPARQPIAGAHRSKLLLVGLLTIAIPAACTRGSGSSTTSTAVTTETFREDARRTCTEILDDRNETVTANAVGARTRLRRAMEHPGEPSDQDLADILDALAAERGQLADARDELTEVVVPPSRHAEWATVVDSVDPVLGDLDSTLRFLRRPDWSRRPDAVGIAPPTPDTVHLEAALTALDLIGTDCQWVYSYPGNPGEDAPFQQDAAEACATAVERRRSRGFDPRRSSVARRRSEWALTADDLAKIDGTTLDDPTPWERVVAAARAAAGTGREVDVSADLEALGLDMRPCEALWVRAANEGAGAP